MTTILRKLADWDISILNVTLDHVKTLEQLSHPVANGRPHEDPVDRMLISQAIFERLTLVSADLKFPFYKDHNFDLLQNF
jgi:PIN domain nuclease of toxin-antitoxin system